MSGSSIHRITTRLPAVVATVVLAVTVLAGCATSDTAAEGSSATPTAATQTATPRAVEDTATLGPTASTPSSTATDAMPPVDAGIPTTATSPITGASMSPQLEPVVTAAIADLETRTGVSDPPIEVLVARAETFPDGAIGCPRDGEVATQGQVDGFRVLLHRDGRVWLYTAADDGQPRLCESEQKDGGYDFVPPPGFDE